MRKPITVLTGLIVLNALAVGAWAWQRSQQRAKEITSEIGSIKISAGGVLNTTIKVYDANDIANAAFDYDLLENHREALLQLGFSNVHVETAKGQTLDKPL
jgi:hypothetical protein